MKHATFREDQLQIYTITPNNDVRILSVDNLCEYQLEPITPTTTDPTTTATTATTFPVTSSAAAIILPSLTLASVSRHSKCKGFMKIQFHFKAISNENLVLVFFTLRCGRRLHVSPFFHPCLSKHSELSHLQTQFDNRRAELEAIRSGFVPPQPPPLSSLPPPPPPPPPQSSSSSSLSVIASQQRHPYQSSLSMQQHTSPPATTSLPFQLSSSSSIKKHPLDTSCDPSIVKMPRLASSILSLSSLAAPTIAPSSLSTISTTSASSSHDNNQININNQNPSFVQLQQTLASVLDRLDNIEKLLTAVPPLDIENTNENNNRFLQQSSSEFLN